VRDPRFAELERLISQTHPKPGRPKGSEHPNGPQSETRVRRVAAHAAKMRARAKHQLVLRARARMLEEWRRRRDHAGGRS